MKQEDRTNVSAERAVLMPKGYRKLKAADLENWSSVEVNGASEGVSGSSGSVSAANAPVMLLGVTYNTNNYGVRVLLSSAVASLNSANSKRPLRILDYQHDPAVWDEETPAGRKSVCLVNLRFSWRLNLPNNAFRLFIVALLSRLIVVRSWRFAMLSRNWWLRQILDSSSCLSLAGGDSFSDIYGLRRLLYVTLPQLLVLVLNKPLILLPQTYGPFKSDSARWIARFILKRSTAIYSRDCEGALAVSGLIGKDAKVQVVPDLGFSMAPDAIAPEISAQLSEWRSKRPIVGLNVSMLLYMGGYTRENMFGLKEEHSQFINRLIDRLLQETPSFLLLVPHVFGDVGESEVVLCRELFPKLEKLYPGRVGFIDRAFSHREIKSVIGGCDVFAGGRMHACIAAVSQCVPTVALAYSDKFAGVMDVVGSFGVHVLDLRRSGADEGFVALKQALDCREQMHHDLCEKIPLVKESIRGVFSGVGFQKI